MPQQRRRRRLSVTCGLLSNRSSQRSTVGDWLYLADYDSSKKIRHISSVRVPNVSQVITSVYTDTVYASSTLLASTVGTGSRAAD